MGVDRLLKVKSVEIGGATTRTGGQSYSMISAILRSPKSSGQRELNIALRAELCNTLVTVALRQPARGLTGGHVVLDGELIGQHTQRGRLAPLPSRELAEAAPGGPR
jgi:hypothetical protein